MFCVGIHGLADHFYAARESAKYICIPWGCVENMKLAQPAVGWMPWEWRMPDRAIIWA